jgi:hypothetical protein
MKPIFGFLVAKLISPLSNGRILRMQEIKVDLPVPEEPRRQ